MTHPSWVLYTYRQIIWKWTYVKTQGAIKNEQSYETGNIQDEDKQNKNTTKGVASLFCSASNQTQNYFFY